MGAAGQHHALATDGLKAIVQSPIAALNSALLMQTEHGYDTRVVRQAFPILFQPLKTLTVAETVVQVGCHCDGGQPDGNGLLKACGHARLEVCDVSRRGLRACVPTLPVVAVVGHIALRTGSCQPLACKPESHARLSQCPNRSRHQIRSKQYHLGVDALALLGPSIDPEEGRREHETRLLCLGSRLHHLHAPGSAAVDIVVSRAHQQDLHGNHPCCVGTCCLWQQC